MPSPPDYVTLRLFLDGMLTMMALYAAVSYLLHRNPMYLSYAGYILLMIARFFLRDYWGSNPGWESVGRLAEDSAESLACVFYIWFAITLQDYSKHDPKSHRILRIMVITIWISIGLEVILWWLNVPIPIRVAVFGLSRLVLIGGTVYIVPRMIRLKLPVGSYFITGTALFVAGGVISLQHLTFPHLFDNDPANGFTIASVYQQMGVVLEILCFSMGMSVKSRMTEREKIRYQAQLIEQLRENERKQTQLNTLRDEIARDLHDEMGSQLSSISILSQTTLRHVTDERARQRLQAIGQTARQVIDSMREVVWSLNSGSDSLQNVALRIRETAHLLFDDTNTQLVVSMPDTIQTLNLTARQRRDLFLIAKESLTNIVRHANANRVWLALRQTPDGLVLSIADNGVGFDTSQSHSGLGMVSLRQRATQFGGLLRIETEPGRGTLIQLTYPDPTLAKPTIDQPKKQTVKQL